MNVLLFSQFFSTTRGGGELLFSNIAKALADDGHHVWVITNKIINEKYPIHENIQIIFVPPELEHKGGLPTGLSENLRYTFGTIVKGLWIIKKEKIDIIQSNNFSPAIAGSILSLLTSKPHITVIYDVFSVIGKEYWKMWGRQENVSKLSALLGPIFEKLLIKMKCSAIHTISEASKDDLLAFGAKKPIYVIPTAIYIDEPKKYEITPLQFICIGRLVFYKNMEVIIKAIKIVKKSFPKVILIIIGVGPTRKNLEKLVAELELKENVKFQGYVSNEQKLELLSTSHALLFPSLFEGFGLVILEAFAQNKPALVSNVRPLSDIVTHNKTGFVISPHDEDAWAKAIIRIINEPENAQMMGNLGRKVLEEKYNVEIMKDKIVKMYNEIIE